MGTSTDGGELDSLVSIEDVSLVRDETSCIGVEFARVGETGPYTVMKLKPKGAAARSGQLHIGDLILDVNGEAVDKMDVDQLAQAIKGEPGSEVKLKITARHSGLHNSDRIKTVIIERERGKVGISFVRFERPGPYLVRSLDPEAPAARSGSVSVGDSIHAIDGHIIYTVSCEEVQALFRGDGSSSSVALRICSAHEDSKLDEKADWHQDVKMNTTTTADALPAVPAHTFRSDISSDGDPELAAKLAARRAWEESMGTPEAAAADEMGSKLSKLQVAHIGEASFCRRKGTFGVA